MDHSAPIRPDLRPYQLEALGALAREVGQGNRRVVLQAGTGTGKTVIAAALIERALAKGSSILFLAHRRELVKQCSRKLSDLGVPHGIIMAGESDEEAHRAVQVASVQTFHARAIRNSTMEIPSADIIILDECHRSLAPTYRRIIESYPGAMVLGLTATPARGDGTGLGSVYDSMVCCPPFKSMQDDGYLVGTRYFAPTQPDLDGIRIRRGDYAEDELAERMDRAVLVGDIVEHWGRYAAGRKTVVFATSVKHSRHLRDAFEAAGVRAAHLDAKTPSEERDRILRNLSGGAIEVVCNCMILSEGWDQPKVSCVVLARPTKSLVLYLQMVGRILRPAEGKQDALILDHAGNVLEHGFVEEFNEWFLDEGRAQRNPIQERRKAENARPIICEQCFATFVGRRGCPECGHENERKGRDVQHIDGELGEVCRDTGQVKQLAAGAAKKEAFYRGLLGHAALKGYKPGWAAWSFKSKYGHWPLKVYSREPIQPSVEVLGWIRHSNIRRAKARAKGA